MAKGRPTDSSRINSLEEKFDKLVSLVENLVEHKVPTPVQPAQVVKPAPVAPKGDVLSRVVGNKVTKPSKESIRVQNFGCEWIHPTPRGTTEEKADYLKAAAVVNRRGQQSDRVVYLIPVTAEGTCAAASDDLRELMEECRETTQRRFWFRSFVDEEQGVALPPRYTVAIDRITDEVKARIIE